MSKPVNAIDIATRYFLGDEQAQVVQAGDPRGAIGPLLAALEAIAGCECDSLAGGAGCKTLLCRTCVARQALAELRR
jgi:hypothetical protein